MYCPRFHRLQQQRCAYHSITNLIAERDVAVETNPLDSHERSFVVSSCWLLSQVNRSVSPGIGFSLEAQTRCSFVAILVVVFVVSSSSNPASASQNRHTGLLLFQIDKRSSLIHGGLYFFRMGACRMTLGRRTRSLPFFVFTSICTLSRWTFHFPPNSKWDLPNFSPLRASLNHVKRR